MKGKAENQPKHGKRYATSKDWGVRGKSWGRTVIGGGFATLVGEKEVWFEKDQWQTRGDAMMRTHKLVKLLQQAFDAGADWALNSKAGF